MLDWGPKGKFGPPLPAVVIIYAPKDVNYTPVLGKVHLRPQITLKSQWLKEAFLRVWFTTWGWFPFWDCISDRILFSRIIQNFIFSYYSNIL